MSLRDGLARNHPQRGDCATGSLIKRHGLESEWEDALEGLRLHEYNATDLWKKLVDRYGKFVSVTSFRRHINGLCMCERSTDESTR